jgi:hypothetical protein
MMGSLGAEPIGGHGRNAQALALVATGRHPQALLTPQALDLLAVHGPAFATQHGVRSPVAPAGMALGEAPQPVP